MSAWVRRARQRQPALAGPTDVRWCYRLLLGREPDDHGYRGYVDLVTTNAVSRDELVGYFVASPEFRDRLSEEFDYTEGTPVATAVEDLTIYVDPDDTTIGSFLRKSGAYEPEVSAVIRRHLRKGDRFVDCGASFGFFSALAGSIVGPEGSVVSFEPGPQNQSLLLLNLMANDILTAEVHQVALSDRIGILRYGRSGANGAISDFDGDPSQLGTYDLVRSTTLDTVIGERRVDMMKVDVEGAEGRVFRGAEQVLKRCTPTLVFEFSPPSLAITSGMGGDELLGFLTGLDYSLDVIGSDPGERRPRSVPELVARFDGSPGDHIDLIAWNR
ncbi:MAG: FkbM family methyltransferase [Acidimicrobiales bacterium]|jgi:FkbM family methyltransferase